MAEFLKLKRSNCKNCYRCIRACPVKSIRFSAGQANIVGDECILCGQCFVVCPQNAKEIASGVEQVKVLLAGNAPVYASVAPSFIANYNGAGIEVLETGLKALGFAGAEETALGATHVTPAYEQRRRDGQVAVERIGPRLPEILLRCGIVGMRGTETERQTEGLRQIDFAQESLRLVARIAGQVYRIAVDRLVEIAAAVGEFAAAVVEVGRVEEPLRTGIGDAELPDIGGRIAARTQQAG